MLMDMLIDFMWKCYYLWYYTETPFGTVRDIFYKVFFIAVTIGIAYIFVKCSLMELRQKKWYRRFAKKASSKMRIIAYQARVLYNIFVKGE